ELEALWGALAEDASRAHAAIWRMASRPREMVPFLHRRLMPVQPVPAEQLARLVAELEAPRFSVRERASDELERIGPGALPALRKALAGHPSLEVRRRCEDLLKRSQAPVPSPRRLREIRAVAALEYTGTDEARRLLEVLAGGVPEARLT